MYYADRLMEFPSGVLGVALGVDSLLPDLVDGDPGAEASARAVCDVWVFLRRAQEAVVELLDRVEKAEGRPGVHVAREDGPRFDAAADWREGMLAAMEARGPQPPPEDPWAGTLFEGIA